MMSVPGLDPDDEALWLDPAAADRSHVLACLRAYPAEWMEAYPVASPLSSARNEGRSWSDRARRRSAPAARRAGRPEPRPGARFQGRTLLARTAAPAPSR